MTNNIITDEELNQFRSLPVRKIVDSMEAYLIGINGQRYNMKEAGAAFFGDENYSFTVSLIHRCYNFSGQNSGRYSNGCKFEKIYGYRITRKDIEAFVKKYPNGTFSTGITFEDFLLTIVNSAKAKRPKPQPIQRTNASQFNVPNNDSYNYGNNQEYDKKFLMVMIGVGCLGVLIMLLILFTGNLFKHWIISLVVLFFTIGAFGSLVVLQDGGPQGTQESFAENDYPDSRSYGNAPRSRRFGIDFDIVDRLREKSLSSILTTILVLVLVANFSISALITQEPLSTRFWALFIALATTKGMIFDAKEFGLFGKAIVLGIVWLAASNFL